MTITIKIVILFYEWRLHLQSHASCVVVAGALAYLLKLSRLCLEQIRSKISFAYGLDKIARLSKRLDKMRT